MERHGEYEPGRDTLGEELRQTGLPRALQPWPLVVVTKTTTHITNYSCGDPQPNPEDSVDTVTTLHHSEVHTTDQAPWGWTFPCERQLVAL